MSTPVISPSPDPQVQAVPTPAGTPPVAPVQPRHPDGTFAPVAVQPPPATPPVQPPTTPAQAQPPAVQTPPAPAPPAAPSPFSVQDLGNGNIKVTYETGESFEGTPQKVVELTAAAHINTKRWAQQQRVQPAQPQPAAPATPQPPSKFADATEEAAATQLLNLVAKAVGYNDGSELVGVLGRTTNTSQDYLDNQLSIQFMAANRDYNPTGENSEKLINSIVQMGFGELYEKGDQSQRLNLMNMAHALNLKQGVYQPMPAQATPPAVNPAITPPPPLPQGRAPQDPIGNIPPELVLDVNDSQAVILGKIAKLKQMGLMQ